METLVRDGFCTRTESVTFESKRCEDKLPRDIWQTYSAFANTYGGEIVLGFTELPDKRLQLTGVSNPEKVVKEIWDLLHDGHKVSANLLTEDDVKIIECGELSYILIKVPRADRYRRPIYINNDLDNGTYRRNNDGDYHCTIPEILEMGRDASDTAVDQRILENTSIKDINKETLNRYRNLLRSNNPEHPWLTESEEEFLRLIGAADYVDDKLMLTQAGILMFGNDYRITHFLPSYHLDYQEYNGGDDWADRISSDTGLWSGNIFDFYLEVSKRLFLINRHPFLLKGDIRNDDTDMIVSQREAVLNGIVHADYMGKGGILVKSSADSLLVRNPGCFRISPDKAMRGGYSDARNPQIMKMFTLVGLVERAGSGIYRIMHTSLSNGLKEPDIKEDTDPSTVEFTIYFNGNDVSLEQKILMAIGQDPTVTMDELAERTKVSRSTIYRTIESLKKNGAIKRIGGPKGRWELTVDCGSFNIDLK